MILEIEVVLLGILLKYTRSLGVLSESHSVAF